MEVRRAGAGGGPHPLAGADCPLGDPESTWPLALSRRGQSEEEEGLTRLPPEPRDRAFRWDGLPMWVEAPGGDSQNPGYASCPNGFAPASLGLLLLHLNPTLIRQARYPEVPMPQDSGPSPVHPELPPVPVLWRAWEVGGRKGRRRGHQKQSGAGRMQFSINSGP